MVFVKIVGELINYAKMILKIYADVV